jgi:hypothetical protein
MSVALLSISLDRITTAPNVMLLQPFLMGSRSCHAESWNFDGAGGGGGGAAEPLEPAVVAEFWLLIEGPRAGRLAAWRA